MTEQPEPTRTIREFALAASMSAERLQQHFAAGRLRIDGEVVTDLDQPAPDGARINAYGS